MIPLNDIRAVRCRAVVNIHQSARMQGANDIVFIIHALHNKLLAVAAVTTAQQHVCTILRTCSVDIQHITVIAACSDVPNAVQSHRGRIQHPLLRVAAVRCPDNERRAVVIHAVRTVKVQVVAL